ncbi:hypothetical protein N0Y54_33245 [Nostoc punctiforme UO1]|uniref:hypothetical protein n=1 Tax=Nostoc punctiforme TaxID=272131 RepID=UPI00309B59A6
MNQPLDISLKQSLWENDTKVKKYSTSMTNPLVKIESHPQSAKLVIGINYEQFMTLVVWAEQRHNQKRRVNNYHTLQ